MSRLTLRAPGCAAALAALLATSELRADPVFLLDASATTIFDVVPAWTQASACDCCVCWETALGTIFSYWDDVYYPSSGPWESLLLYGNRTTAAAFKAATQRIWELSGLDCNEGASSVPFWSSQALDAADAYTDGYLGYSFSYDFDDWVWWQQDITDEIDADRPVYYAYEPEGTGAHAVTIVGYDDDGQILQLYKNWDPVLTLKGFDEATDHRAINIVPGGDATVPGDWTCAASYHESFDGCDCNCGSYDPDCDNDPVALGCEADQSCNADGICVGCDDECDQPAGPRCTTQGEVVSCSDTDADGCLELGTPSECDAGSVCQDGNCIECTCTEPGARECVNDNHYRLCSELVTDCSRWGTSTPCPDGQLCVAGQCEGGAGGSGTGAGGTGAGGTGTGATGATAGAPNPPDDDEPSEDSGCCAIAPGRAGGASGRALLALALGAVALWSRRRTSRGR